MHYEEMLTWLLFYTSLLDLKKIPPQDVADPGGLVKSQVIESADGSLRIILNASQSQRTQSSRFLTEVFGSGVQHLAFATADMFATVARLKRNGVELLQIPENYYDDLEAKMDLPPEQLDALKAHNILYDRDGDGEYLQVYTRSFEQRFFEIVERRGYRATVRPTLRSGSRLRHGSSSISWAGRHPEFADTAAALGMQGWNVNRIALGSRADDIVHQKRAELTSAFGTKPTTSAPQQFRLLSGPGAPLTSRGIAATARWQARRP